MSPSSYDVAGPPPLLPPSHQYPVLGRLAEAVVCIVLHQVISAQYPIDSILSKISDGQSLSLHNTVLSPQSLFLHSLITSF